MSHKLLALGGMNALPGDTEHRLISIVIPLFLLLHLHTLLFC